MSDLNLEQLLSGEWLNQIGPIIKKQPDVSTYLGSNRDTTLPLLENTFAALKTLQPSEVKVVIFGQDPYPREESATGIAFNDGAIKKWTDKLSPSFRNIIKNILISEGLLDKKSNIAKLRQVCKSSKIMDPPDWFKSTEFQGVCWLNTSLTFTSTDKDDLKRHVDFWHPIILSIVQTIINAKKNISKKGSPGHLIFVLWGAFAKKLKPKIMEFNESTDPKINLHFVEGNHPAVESFHNVETFAMVNEFLESEGATKINWISKKEGDEEEDEVDEEEVDKKKVTKRKRQSTGKGSKEKKKTKYSKDDSDE